MRTVKTLIRLGGCSGWSESLLGAHIILLVLFCLFCLCWGLTSQSTIFQSCRDGATASWVINQYFRGVKCLAQGHNTAAVLVLSWGGSYYLWNDRLRLSEILLLPWTVHKTKTAFEFIMRTVCLSVNVSSAKTNILLDGATTAKVKLNFLSFHAIPG